MAIVNLIQGPNLGDEFSIGDIEAGKIRIRTGPGITRNASNELELDLTVTSQVLDLEETFLGAAEVTAGQNANVNANLDLTLTRTDTGWAFAVGNELRYTGSPDRVELAAMVHQVEQGAVARVAPSFRIERSNGGAAFVPISPWSSTGYIRDTTGHSESSNTVAYVDHDPGVDPRYRLLARQESTTATTPVGSGSLSAVAVVKSTQTVVTGIAAN